MVLGVESGTADVVTSSVGSGQLHLFARHGGYLVEVSFAVAAQDAGLQQIDGLRLLDFNIEFKDALLAGEGLQVTAVLAHHCLNGVAQELHVHLDVQLAVVGKAADGCK